MVSPNVEIKDGAGAYVPMANGVDVTPGNTITIHLIDTSARSWSLSCLTTDELSSASAVDAVIAGTIDPIANTATFVAPAAGRNYRFRTQVNGGVGPDGKVVASYTATFCIYTLTASGRRVRAADETIEGDSTFGWIGDINALIRNPTALVAPGGAGALPASDGAGALVDSGATSTAGAIGGASLTLTGSATAANVRLISGAFKSRLLSGALAGDIDITFPASAQTLVGLTTTDVLTNKTLTSPVLTTPQINDTSADHQYVFAVSELAADRTVTLPLLIAGDTFVFQAHIQALTNKTIAAESNTITGLVDPQTNGLRLSLTTAVPITTTNVTAATDLYLVPHKSGAIAIYDGAQWIVRTTAEVTLALGTLSNDSQYDVFASWSGAAVVLSLSAAWASDTTRTDALARQDGVWVLGSDHTKRYLGTFRTTSTTTTEDSTSKRFLWNQSNRTRRHLSVVESTNSWTYINPNKVWRQANSAAGNAFETVTGEAGVLVEANVSGLQTAGSADLAAQGVGIGSTTVNSAQVFGSVALTTAATPSVARYSGYPAMGYNKINWLETGSSNAITYTFYGDNNNAIIQSGMVGSVEG